MSKTAPTTAPPTMSVTAIRNALLLDHYVLAAYDSIEERNLKIVVIMPGLAEPTWVLRPRARAVTPGSVMALALPSLAALTLELAQTHTRMRIDYITIYELTRNSRSKGRVERGPAVPVPWTQSPSNQKESHA